MGSRVAIIPFFNYGQGNEQVLWKFFLLHLKKWIKWVDRVYIIDSGCNLELPEDFFQAEKIQIVKKPPQSHWQNMNEAIRNTAENLILLLDSDMVIYNDKVIHTGFWKLEQGWDVASILDSSGGQPINHPAFTENQFRFERRRLCPYLCFIKRNALRPDFDFTPRGGENWTDSMGTVTEQLVADGKKIYELQDDRATISLEDDGRITSVQWLDTPPKKWALDEHPNLGYYHIRNFGGGLKLWKEKEFGLVPGREARRLLAWVWVLKAGIGEDMRDQTIVDPILPKEKWVNYFKKFAEYHSWLNLI